MKIRSSFVSNSSSSSFVVRGARIKVEDVVAKLNLDNEDKAFNALEKVFYSDNYVVHHCQNYFNYWIKDTHFIVGYDCGDMEDGEVYSSKDFKCPVTDKKIIKRIKSKLDIDVSELDTFVQYVSNDNC